MAALMLWPWSKRAVSKPRLVVTATVHYPERPDHSAEIEQWLTSHPEFDKWFFSSIAGVTHRNNDGSSRQKAIKKCQPFEMLKLTPEPNNQFDPNAIAVFRTTGEQLGYLERRLASETCRRTQKGQHWEAMVFAVTGDASPRGINIVMLRLKSAPTHKTA